MRRLFIIPALFFAAALLIFIAVLILREAGGHVGESRRLPDGSTLVLQEMVLTATNFGFSYPPRGKLMSYLAPILPAFIQKRFGPGAGSGSLGFSSGDSETNLVLITIHRSKAQNWKSTLDRLQIINEDGTPHDASFGASTLGMGNAYVHGWRIQTFPRRHRMLKLRFLALQPDGTSTNVADFRVRNPLYAGYSQWKPESAPHVKHDGSLAVTLAEFKAGLRSTRKHQGSPFVSRMNRLVFTFAEEGASSDDWRIQKITLFDATGNRWSPYLDFVKQDFNWVTNGTAQFFGALWPEEDAWKLRVEVVRSGGFAPEELWEVPITLPTPRIVDTLTNSWQRHGATVKFAAIASPETDHTGDFRWIAKWWGSEKSKVYSLAVSFQSPAKDIRLTFVRCLDQNGEEIKLVGHQGQDSDKQAIFLRPRSTATEARLTLAVQRSSTVEFLARPEFVTEHTATP